MTWAPAYVSTAELKSYLRIGDTDDDTELDFAIEAASRAVDHSTNRQFGLVATAEARHYSARWDRKLCRFVADIDDLMTTTGLLVAHDDDDDGVYDDDTWTLDATDGFYLAPRNAPDTARPWTQVVWRSAADNPTAAAGAVQVTARYGWSAVPDTIKKATLVQAARFFYRREAPFGVAGSPTIGSEIRLLDRIDPDVAVIVRSYRRVWGAV